MLGTSNDHVPLAQEHVLDILLNLSIRFCPIVPFLLQTARLIPSPPLFDFDRPMCLCELFQVFVHHFLDHLFAIALRPPQIVVDVQLYDLDRLGFFIADSQVGRARIAKVLERDVACHRSLRGDQNLFDLMRVRNGLGSVCENVDVEGVGGGIVIDRGGPLAQLFIFGQQTIDLELLLFQCSFEFYRSDRKRPCYTDLEMPSHVLRRGVAALTSH